MPQPDREAGTDASIAQIYPAARGPIPRVAPSTELGNSVDASVVQRFAFDCQEFLIPNGGRRVGGCRLFDEAPRWCNRARIHLTEAVKIFRHATALHSERAIGTRPEEIAGQGGVALNTIRTRIKSLIFKTSSSRQSDLPWLMLSLSFLHRA